ncbi:hypothetical protein SAMN05414139_06179 [Burkholderia sp. D7]|nr:hypothetical protein SAMN05414139_06179 [Burkholderia sp. D7]
MSADDCLVIGVLFCGVSCGVDERNFLRALNICVHYRHIPF